MKANERLQILRKELRLNQSQLADALFIKQGSYSDIERGKVGVSRKIILLLERDFNVNSKWITEGEGDMFLKNKEHNAESSCLLGRCKGNSTDCIRYYDVDASASQVEMFKDKNKVEYQDLCVPGFNDCTIALNVWGDSMIPILKSGEIVMLKEWNESFIEYGHIYMIVTKNNHRMIKYIQPDKSEESVLCESANDFYKPFPIKREDILKLYVVKGHIERNAI